MLRIVAFSDLTGGQRTEAARILRDAFAHLEDAFDGEFEAEVDSFSTDPDRAALAALDDDTLLGWIGRVATYDYAWELHPLAVDPPHQRKGIGAALVEALEAELATAGILTLYLGTDDDFGGTSLFGQDLFPDVAARIATVTPTTGHPFAFYQKLGYEIVGLIPDANGFGKPDIMMAKRLRTAAAT